MTEELVKGLGKLKAGALLELLALIVAIVASVILFLSISINISSFEEISQTANFSTFPIKNLDRTLTTSIGLLGVSLGIFIISLVMFITAFVLWFISTGHLRNHNSELGVGRIGMIFQIVAILLIIASFVPFILIAPSQNITAMMSAATGFALCIIVAFIIALVGAVLFGVMLLRLSNEQNVDSGFRTAGILYIVAIVLSIIPVINIVAWILSLVSIVLIYTSAGKSLEALQSALPKE